MIVFTWAQFPASPGSTGAVPWAFGPDWLDDLPQWYTDEVTPTPTPGPTGAVVLPLGGRRRRRRIDDDELLIIGAL